MRAASAELWRSGACALLACLLWLPAVQAQEADAQVHLDGGGLKLPADPAGALPLGPRLPGLEPGPAQASGDEDDGPDADDTPLESGLASWYGRRFHKRRTASGELFDMNAMTAAHRTLAFGTRICVRNRETGKGVVVRVNDRGPHVANRIVDLSQGAAMALGLYGVGLKAVDVLPLVGDATTCPP